MILLLEAARVARLAMPFCYPIFAHRRALNASPVTYRRAIREILEGSQGGRVLGFSSEELLDECNQDLRSTSALQAREDEHGGGIRRRSKSKASLLGRGPRSLARSMTFPACCDGAPSKYDESSRTEGCILGPGPAQANLTFARTYGIG